ATCHERTAGPDGEGDPPRRGRHADRHVHRVVRLLRLRRGGRPGVRQALLPLGEPAHRHAAGAVDVRGRLRRPPVRRRDLRALRGPDRAQVDARPVRRDDGRRHVPRRAAADLRDHRRRRADPARAAADRAGHRPGGRVGRGRGDGGRVRAAEPPRLLRQLPADGGAGRHAHREPLAAHRVRGAVRRGVPVLGLAAAVPRLDRAGRRRHRDPPPRGRVPGLRGGQERREDRAAAGDRGAAPPAAERPAGRGPAVRREQHVLHPHHVRPDLRHGRARAGAQRPAARGHRLLGPGAGQHPVLRLGLRPVRATAGGAVGLAGAARHELAVLLGAGHAVAALDRAGHRGGGEHRQLRGLRAAARLLLRAVRAGGALQRGVDRGPGRERVRGRAGPGDRHSAAGRDRRLGLDRGLHVGDGADHDRRGAVLAGPVPGGVAQGRNAPGL
ncbi:MAG: Uncharacterized MFS-type transporter, partial [uncultured Actinomycetospora sp.]